jgi:cAMP phosphodiesterase
VQGSGGGPSEDNVTGLLVRSMATDWARGSLLAVDAGSHLAAITRIFEKNLPNQAPAPHQPPPPPQTTNLDGASSPTSSSPPTRNPIHAKPLPEPIVLDSGPFAGLSLPHASARANAAHVVRAHVSTYLITHPHLDHLSGFAINTAAFHATSRPKRLAALPFTVEAIKKHIFNDVIWPNLTDEDGGVGFVTFQRLREGGDLIVGMGEGRGYIEVCDGLGVKGFKVSHGNCMKDPLPTRSQRGSLGSISEPDYSTFRVHDNNRNLSIPHMFGNSNGMETPGQPGYFTPALYGRSFTSDPTPLHSVVDSTAFFIRDYQTSKEVLIFGDVEPDSLSRVPRLAGIWAEAAPKIAEGILSGIFIECSYDDSQPDAVLFGHLAPRHVVAEMRTLAQMVKDEKASRALDRAQRKRKRSSNSLNVTMEDASDNKKRSKSVVGRSCSLQPRHGSLPLAVPEEEAQAVTSDYNMMATERNTPVPADAPLQGVKVVLIHIKDTMEDGPHVGERILEQLHDHADALYFEGFGKLGCEFVISQSGQDYFF